jgi:transposase
LNGATLLFEDEVLFQQEGTIRQSWARRGVGFAVYKHPCKKKCKFYGAVSIEEKPSFVFQKSEWFNSKTFKQFLEYLLTVFEKIYLILDNVRYHKAKKLEPFLEENKERLTLFFLPPYSPELNAVEPVWKNTRKDSTHNRYFATMKCLTRAVQTRFRIYQKEPWRLASTIAHFL